MPLTPPGVASLVAPALAGAGLVGTGAVQLASGIGIGVCSWVAVLGVATVDVGTLGSGSGAIPCAIPPPLLLGGMVTGLSGASILGVAAPLLAAAISNGLAAAFVTQGVVVTVNPVIGLGTSFVSFLGPSAIPFMVGGLAGAGMLGTNAAQLGAAIGTGLDIAFAGFRPVVPIVGVGTPTSGQGLGTGKIV